MTSGIPSPLLQQASATLISILATMALGACGSAPQAPVREKASATTTLSSSPASSGSPSRKKNGGYYLDDGPDDNPPTNLDSVPDAQPRQEPLHRFANRPYSALGQQYVPQINAKGYRATGIASWYGKRYHGQNTSSGERYDMYGMTAAHTTLPIPSYVRVTNPDTGKSVVVRVNDRGPFHSDRLIDLSYTAAWKLGIIGKGSGKVIVEGIDPDNLPLSSPSGSLSTISAPPVAVAATNLNNPQSSEKIAPGLYLQMGAFSTQENAAAFRDHIGNDLQDLAPLLKLETGSKLTRVLAGPYNNKEAALLHSDDIFVKLGVKPSIITRP